MIIAVYSYFACEILASQSLERPDEDAVDFFIPIFSIFYFLFLMGWLKVALCVMNPFGDDDEDFETSDILNYNLDVSYRTVLMADSTYPQQLAPHTWKEKAIDGHENDNLNEFIEKVGHELENVDITDFENE